MYDRYIPIQTLIIALLRNVTLTVLKGAWATCGQTTVSQPSEHISGRVYFLQHKRKASHLLVGIFHYGDTGSIRRHVFNFLW